MSTSTDAWEALHRAQISGLRELRRGFQLEAVTFGEYDVLHVLSTVGEEGMRLKRLNEYVALTQSSLSRMLDRLEARRFVLKWQDPEDARGLLLRLTDQGRELHATIGAAHDTRAAEFMDAALTPEEIDTLTRLTTKLHTQS